MQRKVVAKKALKKKRSVRKMPRKPAVPSTAVTGYEDALLKGVIGSHSKHAVNALALEFSSMLSSLTPSMREMQHKHGFRIGRMLYQLYEQNRKYIWYEESISDLVSFLEAAGLGKVAYNVFPDTVSIRLYNRNAPRLGIAIHEFEAGLISGFVSTGRHQLTEIHEARCSRGGYEQCEFTRSPKQSNEDASEEYAISRLIDNAVMALKDGKHDDQIPLEYYMLASSTLFRNEYMHALRNIASYIGNEFATAMRLTANRNSLEGAERLTKLLNLGSLTINSLKPLSIELEFEGLSSRREHVELSLAFLDGLLSRLLKGKSNIESIGARSSGGYRVRLIEKKQVR